MESRWFVERSMRGPDWRHQLAIAGAQEANLNPRLLGDKTIKRASRYYRMLQRAAASEQEAHTAYPDIGAAHVAWSDSRRRSDLKLMIIGDLPAQEIADQLIIPTAIVQVIEELFFDVRQMLAFEVWIVSQVIQREADRGLDDLAAHLRMAFFGGPVAVRQLSSARTRLSTDMDQQLYDASLLLHVKVQQALEMPLEASKGEAFLQLWAQIRHEDQLIALEREKLKARTARWSQHCQLARERTELLCRSLLGSDCELVEDVVPRGESSRSK